MAEHATLPSLDSLKDQARRLRETLARQGTQINHSKALELIAAQLGFRDWNTLHARIGNQRPKPVLALGARLSGHYLGQAFTGEIIAIQALTSAHGKMRVTFDFDEPVDVAAPDFVGGHDALPCENGPVGDGQLGGADVAADLAFGLKFESGGGGHVARHFAAHKNHFGGDVAGDDGFFADDHALSRHAAIHFPVHAHVAFGADVALKSGVRTNDGLHLGGVDVFFAEHQELGRLMNFPGFTARPLYQTS